MGLNVTESDVVEVPCMDITCVAIKGPGDIGAVGGVELCSIHCNNVVFCIIGWSIEPYWGPGYAISGDFD